jgi:hypothetical protein
MDKREYEFRERHSNGYPWQLQVVLSQVVIGHIRRGGDGDMLLSPAYAGALEVTRRAASSAARRDRVGTPPVDS